MDEAFLSGARLFDEARFFEAHEAWEKHWLVENEETRRRFLQGLIQIAAAFHKRLDKNAPEAAARLFARGLAKLDACPGVLEELALGQFCDDVRAFAANGGAADVDRAALPKLGPARADDDGARAGVRRAGLRGRRCSRAASRAASPAPSPAPSRGRPSRVRRSRARRR